jgi:DNA-binding MarR family transcriptional regulator
VIIQAAILKKIFMAKNIQKSQTAREFAHLTFELRDLLRQFLQKKFRENNIDLTYEMQQIMACLWKTDGLKQQDLADKTLKDKASLTCLIDNLSKRNLVDRYEDPNDRRSKLIFLTAEGKELGKKIEPWIAELFSVVTKNVKAISIKQSIDMVQQMIENVKVN